MAKSKKHTVTEDEIIDNPNLHVGDEIETVDVSDNIKAIFLQMPHIHTVWVNGDEWCFYEKPGFEPIDRHIALQSGE